MSKKNGKDGVCPLRTLRTILRAQGGRSKQHVQTTASRSVNVHVFPTSCQSFRLPSLQSGTMRATEWNTHATSMRQSWRAVTLSPTRIRGRKLQISLFVLLTPLASVLHVGLLLWAEHQARHWAGVLCGMLATEETTL